MFQVTVVVLLSSCTSTPINEEPNTSAEATTNQNVYAEDSLTPTSLPLMFRLPKIEPNPVQFNAPPSNPSSFSGPELMTYLTAPQEDQEHNYYEVPMPAQELVAPIETAWNPSNDPAMYFDVPGMVVQQDLPTREFPKKFVEELHSKKKPYSSKPKQELVVELIDDNEYNSRQKDIQKTFQKLAKKENQKNIKKFKVLKPKKKIVKEPVVAEPEAAGSGFSDQTPVQTFERGLDVQIPASLGIPMHPAGGERLVFHVVGHDGPHSYKWGYDTGKG